MQYNLIKYRQQIEEEEIDADQLLEALTGEISIELVTEKDPQECNASIGKSVSLVGIAESDQINKDAKFLDEIKKLFDEYETSVQFTTARNQLKNAYKAARSSLKKRIRNEKDANTDACNLYLLLLKTHLYVFYICFLCLY